MAGRWRGGKKVSALLEFQNWDFSFLQRRTIDCRTLVADTCCDCRIGRRQCLTSKSTESRDSALLVWLCDCVFLCVCVHTAARRPQLLYLMGQCHRPAWKSWKSPTFCGFRFAISTSKNCFLCACFLSLVFWQEFRSSTGVYDINVRKKHTQRRRKTRKMEFMIWITVCKQQKFNRSFNM